MRNIEIFRLIITKKENNNLLSIMDFCFKDKSEAYWDNDGCYIVSSRISEETMEKKINVIKREINEKSIKFYSSENLEEELKEYLDDTWVDLYKDIEGYDDEFKSKLDKLDYWDKILCLVSKKLDIRVGHMDYRKL